MRANWLGLIPQLTSRWETALYESLSPPSLYGLMSCAVSYAMERLLCEDVRALKRVGDVSESLLVQGDEEVREAVVIGFLEGLTNRCSHLSEFGNIGLFLSMLGPEGASAIDALDRFWGTDIGVRQPKAGRQPSKPESEDSAPR